VDVGQRLFILGPNASGKSNFLDALRFLRDLAVDGGGLQQAIRDRGGMARVRNLAARSFNQGRVSISVELSIPDGDSWRYHLSITSEQRGKRRPVVTEEVVEHNGVRILTRPDEADREDQERLTQTALEQVVANREFRPVNEFLSAIAYLHLVPQLIREPERGGERADDPYGADFLAVVARASQRDRDHRLSVINRALKLAVPQLESLELKKDVDGRPHLEARYRHWREVGARQDESDFSDGTLRLIGLLWSLQDKGKNSAPILLEEPELSLHEAIVRQLPTLMARAARSTGRQVVATTHAHDILEDQGLGLDEVMVLSPSSEGTTAQMANAIQTVTEGVDAGLELNEALAEELRPARVGELVQLPFS
jgi:predicted ATPase